LNKDLLKENRVHGDAMYPISIYEIQCIANQILDCHWHDEMELLMVTAGKAVFQVDTSNFEVHAGQALFINCGEIHAGFPSQHSPCSFKAIVFNPEFLCGSACDIVLEKYIMPVTKRQLAIPLLIAGANQWEMNVLMLISKIFSCNETKSYTYEMLTKAYLLEIFSEFYINCQPTLLEKICRENNYKVERLKSILNYIHANYAKKIGLKDISKFINMSDGQLCRFFKQMMKNTPISYLNYYRTRQAAKLLENSDKKIYEIAMDVGFDSFSYFIVIFKQYNGCTPSDYRRRVCSSNAESFLSSDITHETVLPAP